MTPVELSDKAQAICESNYKPDTNGCSTCPIHSECITNRPVRSFVEIEVWKQRINEAAERVA